MRWLFIILLMLNIAYFSWEFNHQVDMDARNNNAYRQLPNNLHRLMLLSEYDLPNQLLKAETGPDLAGTEEMLADVAPPVFTPEASSVIQDSSGGELVAELPEFNVMALQGSPSETHCVRFGPIAEELLATGLSDWFKSRRATSEITYVDEKARQLFWVYLAPQESRQLAMETISELRSKGIGEYRLISKGNLQNAISLGLFSSQAAVNERLYELEQKGYNPVVVPYNNGKRVYWVNVRLTPDLELEQQIINGYPSRYNSIPVNCDQSRDG